MKLIVVLATYLLTTSAYSYYYHSTPQESNLTLEMRAACQGSCGHQESTYGSVVPSGFTMRYSESYVNLMKYCFGFSTHLEKMMKRALTQNDEKTTKRLECFTKGLGKNLREYEMDGISAIDLANDHENQQAIDYIESL